MTLVAITQRVDVHAGRGERRDALDQRWNAFLGACGLVPLPVPNRQRSAEALLRAVPIGGLVLTGGNTLAAYGGDAPERDATEAWLVAFARDRRLPVIGVCRGMQVIQHHLGVVLTRVDGHVTAAHSIRMGGRDGMVNSYHEFGARDTAPELCVLATAADGIVELVRHAREPILGLMWHPERYEPFRAEDVTMFREWFRDR